VIAQLEQTPPGAQFDIRFMELFSRHHFTIVVASVACLAASELEHDDLERACRNVVNGQLSDIDEMRTLLYKEYQICDSQPIQLLCSPALPTS
jgi:uncharacterized protein (DUF305 family)